MVLRGIRGWPMTLNQKSLKYKIQTVLHSIYSIVQMIAQTFLDFP